MLGTAVEISRLATFDVNLKAVDFLSLGLDSARPES